MLSRLRSLPFFCWILHSYFCRMKNAKIQSLYSHASACAYKITFTHAATRDATQWHKSIYTLIKDFVRRYKEAAARFLFAWTHVAFGRFDRTLPSFFFDAWKMHSQIKIRLYLMSWMTPPSNIICNLLFLSCTRNMRGQENWYIDTCIGMRTMKAKNFI